MRNISLIAFLLIVSFISGADAVSKSDGETYKTEWGVGDAGNYTCLGTASDYGIGTSETGTDREWHKYLNYYFMYDGTHAKGAAYYIAREMTDHGYKFCKTLLGGGRGGCGNDSYTTYYNGDPLDCFWLCEPGYYGDKCESKTIGTGKHDYSKDEARKSYAKNKVNPINAVRYKGSGNKEDEVPMFIKNHYVSCNGGNQASMRHMNKKQEHDVILAIKNIEVDKTKEKVKYTVQPLVHRAAGTQGCFSTSAAHSSFPFTHFVASPSYSLCPGDMMHVDKTFTLNGATDSGGCYTSSEAKANAEVSKVEQDAYTAALERAKALEASGLAILCPGFKKEKFNSASHELVSDSYSYSNWRQDSTKTSVCGGKTGQEKTDCEAVFNDASATCTVFVCKDGKGYKTDPAVTGDFSCVDCSSVSGGTVATDAASTTAIHPSRLGLGSNGVCLTCEPGQIYNADMRGCITAKQIHKNYMAGDVMESARTVKLPVENQCWTKATPEDYKQCMKTNGWAKYKTAESVDNPALQIIIESVPLANQSELIKQADLFRDKGLSDTEIVKQIQTMADFYNGK